ncbi:hypothetical protein LJC32_00700 [Oscillospiraceae bacterium OttesenSCG-928-F05]|nr:hypothetical protein [Oscillospiraceae bacterium OttesenSCG-928-F05]
MLEKGYMHQVIELAYISLAVSQLNPFLLAFLWQTVQKVTHIRFVIVLFVVYYYKIINACFIKPCKSYGDMQKKGSPRSYLEYRD